jgi:hypothetical protein
MNTKQVIKEAQKAFIQFQDPREIKDRLLELDAHMYCNLGAASTAAEKDEVRKTSAQLYRLIKGIKCPKCQKAKYVELGNSFLASIDYSK